jgi:hypothetical protein
MVQQVQDKQVLGTMRGRYRQVLIDFYSGKSQVPKSLQTGMLLGANALWAFGHPLEDRAEYLLGLLQGITVVNPDFSSRLLNQDWDSLLEDVSHTVETVEKVRSAVPLPSQTEKSNKILKNWAKAMTAGGFDFGDPSTWAKCWEGTERGRRFTFVPTEEEILLISHEIAPVFGCDANRAIETVIRMVTLAAIKDRRGDGMSREYRRALLSDQGIHCQENVKLARCWKVVEDAGFIYLKTKHIFSPQRPGEGRANAYAVGKRVRERVYKVRPEDRPVLPEWLKEAIRDSGLDVEWV